MKVCDVADWFSGDLHSVIVNELRDLPRFHRKPWEFAQTFIALRDLGVLRPDAVGISFGAGTDHLLYALLPHIGRLWATDLYDPETIWSTARTNDVETFVKGRPPFPAPTEKLSVKVMDMRTVDFPDESFDFAYSSSAVEHIGTWDDFRTHLNEVRRVLKPGGVYVLTTDIIYGPAWEELGNYKFAPEGLQWWLRESGMAYEPVIDCRIAYHRGNQPMPSRIAPYMSSEDGLARHDVTRDLLQVQNLMGRYPHSSVFLAMRKATPTREEVRFPGYEETKAFLTDYRKTWEIYLARARLNPSPTASIPAHLQKEVWSTAYLLLGTDPRAPVVPVARAVRVRVETGRAGAVTIGVNKIHCDAMGDVVVHEAERVERTTGDIEFCFTIDAEPGWSYAIHGRALDGIELRDVSVSVREQGWGRVEASVTRLVPEVERVEPTAAVASGRKGTGLIRLANRFLHPVGLRLDRP
jgi:SAM-dependent methyltransferase